MRWWIKWSRRFKSPRAPAKWAMARYSFSRSRTWCASERASGTPAPFRGVASMIKLGLILGLLMACTPVVHADESSGAPASAVAAPSAAATAPTPTAPFMLATDKLSSGDTAWMLTSTALVLMMCVPGLALFYGGMVRKKNVLATLMQSFACTCVVTILWWVIGYSWAFTPGNGFFGGASRALFDGVRYVHGDTGSSLSVSHLAPT